MSKHKINVVNHKRISIDLGNKNLHLNLDSKLDVLTVDVNRDETFFCLSGIRNKNANASIFSVERYSFKELSDLITDIIRLKKPEKLYLDKMGLGIGVLDYLIPTLAKERIVLSNSGLLIYDLGDEFLVRV